MEKKISHFGYELIRSEVIKNILGKNANEVLYWTGKELFRSHRLATIEETIAFFEDAGWGTLTIHKIGKDELKLHLTGDLVTYRLKNADADFNLETGFLAEQVEFSSKKRSEATCNMNTKKGFVEIIVKSDLKDDVQE